MRWASAAATGSDLADILARALGEVRDGLGEETADLAFVFVGAQHREEADRVPAAVRESLGDAQVLGCTAGGVIGGGREYENAPAVSILAGRMPGAGVHGFVCAQEDLPDPDAAPAAWHELVGVSPSDSPTFVLIADPFSLRADALIEGLDFAFPGSVTVGGLASGGSRPGEQILFHGDRVRREGAVGVALMGDVELAPAVAQGCRPLGGSMRITACREHLLQALDGQPVLDALRATLQDASQRDRTLAQSSLFLGFRMDPFAEDDDEPWLIRNILGVDSETRGLYVGEHLREGRTVCFHVRDRVTSAEDLQRTLLAAQASIGAAPEGALLFSCLGRGIHLYGAPDHDSQLFAQRFKDVPLGGFFCSGEIGPVGRTTHLHGYTSSFGLIRPRAGS